MKDLILNFLSQKFNKQVTEDSELVDLCQDSIATVEILFDIEKLAEVKIPEDDIFSIEKVQDLINIINKLKNVS